MGQEGGEEVIKDNPDFELEGRDAKAKEEEAEKGGPHPSQGSGVTYWLQPAVRAHVHAAHVEMYYRWLDTGNKI